MKCKKCGKILDEDINFCPICGEKIERSEGGYDEARGNVRPEEASGQNENTRRAEADYEDEIKALGRSGKKSSLPDNGGQKLAAFGEINENMIMPMAAITIALVIILIAIIASQFGKQSENDTAKDDTSAVVVEENRLSDADVEATELAREADAIVEARATEEVSASAAATEADEEARDEQTAEGEKASDTAKEEEESDTSKKKDKDEDAEMAKVSQWDKPEGMVFYEEATRLMSSGAKTIGGGSFLDEQVIEAGNVLVGSGKGEVDLTQESTAEIKLPSSGTCILDPERELYEDGDMYLMCVPCFFGNDSVFEYSGRLHVLFAKTPGADKDYTPLYVTLVKNDMSIISAKASSTAGDNVAKNIFDNNKATAWSEGAMGDGSGQSITLTLTKSTGVSGILLLNGNCASVDTYNEYGKATKIEIDCGNGKKVTADLDYSVDKMGVPKRISLGEMVDTDTVKITILKSAAGTANSDTSFSEVVVY